MLKFLHQYIQQVSFFRVLHILKGLTDEGVCTIVGIRAFSWGDSKPRGHGSLALHTTGTTCVGKSAALRQSRKDRQ